MRKLKMIAFALLSAVIMALFAFEVLAAVYLSVFVEGSVEYYATEIGASVWGTYSYDPEGVTGSANYLSFSRPGGTVIDYVYEITGEEASYGNITANVGSTLFTNSQDTLTFYVFIKNTGDRYLIPSINVTYSDTTHLTSSNETIFFDVSEGDIDPLDEKSNSATATVYVSTISTEIQSGNCMAFGLNSSIDTDDTWCGKITIMLQNTSGQGDLHVESAFTIRIGFMADVQYTSNDILSIYQTQNQSDPNWIKFGYNTQLSANATKLEENNLGNLVYYLRDADEYGNADITFGRDDYQTAVVYKDIDQVNVDIATGEIIGKLSDVNYDFEWYGRPVTLPAGTTLASGRTLVTSETFTVDVYTYYPTMYIRRWVVGNKQWISLSDHDFSGSVQIKGYYTATFEATTFSPVVDANNQVTGYTAAYNTYGIIPRSYVYDRAPLVNGVNNYLINNYGYVTRSGITNSSSQSQMIAWSTNLTKAWETSGLNNQYKQVKGVQGENWTEYVYNILYLVKYANNNSQSMVGNGNVSSMSLYNASGVTVTNSNGVTITTGGNTTNSYYESERGAGTVGVYNSSSKGTATYDSANNYKMSSTGYNAAGMNYGYNVDYTFGTHKTGLYTVQFLTYSDGTTRHLLDGYVGSNSCTSVFCLGKGNPWGNVWTWVFGQAVVSDGTDLYSFVTFEDYDYQNAGSSWYFNNTGGGYSTIQPILTNRGYMELGYTLPTVGNFYQYFGTSLVEEGTEVLMLIGMQKKGSNTANNSTGLCDYYSCNNSTSSLFGVIVGGYANFGNDGGLFCLYVNNIITTAYINFGFRSMLISS